MHTTDDSAAISEGAMKDARSYLAGVFDKGKTNVMRQEPFTYNMEKEMLFSINGKDDSLGRNNRSGLRATMIG